MQSGGLFAVVPDNLAPPAKGEV